MKPKPPPMPLEDLKDILARRKGDRDVLRLLWEIKRLHWLLMDADWVRRSGPSVQELVKGRTNQFWEDVKNEPCVVDQAEWREDLKNGHKALRNSR